MSFRRRKVQHAIKRGVVILYERWTIYSVITLLPPENVINESNSEGDAVFVLVCHAMSCLYVRMFSIGDICHLDNWGSDTGIFAQNCNDVGVRHRRSGQWLHTYLSCRR